MIESVAQMHTRDSEMWHVCRGKLSLSNVHIRKERTAGENIVYRPIWKKFDSTVYWTSIEGMLRQEELGCPNNLVLPIGN